METFSALLVYDCIYVCVCVCVGGGGGGFTGRHDIPLKGQWRGALMFSLIYAWTHGWVNNPDAAEMRRHRAHYDVSWMH